MSFVIFNNQLIAANEVSLEQLQRLWQFGDGIFETIKVVDGKPLLFELHFERLSKSIRLLDWDFQIPEIDMLEQSIKLLSDKSLFESARVKIFVYRNGGGTYFPENDSTFSVLITISELPYKNYVLNEEGLRITKYDLIPKPSSILSLIKTTSAIQYVQAAEFARQSGYDDALLINEWGRVCEAISSNLFLIINNELYTPPLSEFCLNGVMRKHIIRTARKHHTYVNELPLDNSLIDRADSLFICNAIKGIQWVSMLNEKKYENHSLISKLQMSI